MVEHRNPESKFPGLGAALAVCENGHRANVRNGEFPFVGACSKCDRQVTWYKIERE